MCSTPLRCEPEETCSKVSVPVHLQYKGASRGYFLNACLERRRNLACERQIFSKLSALVHLLYKVTIYRTFQVVLLPSANPEVTIEPRCGRGGGTGGDEEKRGEEKRDGWGIGAWEIIVCRLCVFVCRMCVFVCRMCVFSCVVLSRFHRCGSCFVCVRERVCVYTQCMLVCMRECV